jgi:hypothetical protein
VRRILRERGEQTQTLAHSSRPFFSHSILATTFGAPQSSVLRNSTPKRWRSPAIPCRQTRAWMGGVSAGSRSEGDGGAGIVKFRTWSVRNTRLIARKAPVALMSRVFVRSRKSAPVESTPRTNRGIWTRIRGERRRSAILMGIAFSGDKVVKLISLLLQFSTFGLVPLSS